jgi:hypothetical protein
MFWESMESDEFQKFDNSGAKGSCMGDNIDAVVEGNPLMPRGIPAVGRVGEAEGMLVEELV